LNYASDRVPGGNTANTLTIPLSDTSVPLPLDRIDLEVLIAGQRISRSFPPTPNQSTTFTWDGKDGYGRNMQGEQPFTIRVGYHYAAAYLDTPGVLDATFAIAGSGNVILSSAAKTAATFKSSSADLISAAKAPATFGSGSANLIISGADGQPQDGLTLWQEHHGVIGTFDARGLSLGGWSLSVHHAYDPTGRTLYLGNGERRSPEVSIPNIITTVAGGTRSPGGRMAAPARGFTRINMARAMRISIRAMAITTLARLGAGKKE